MSLSTDDCERPITAADTNLRTLGRSKSTLAVVARIDALARETSDAGTEALCLSSAHANGTVAMVSARTVIGRPRVPPPDFTAGGAVVKTRAPGLSRRAARAEGSTACDPATPARSGRGE